MSDERNIFDLGLVEEHDLSKAGELAQVALAGLALFAERYSPGFLEIAPLAAGGTPDGRDAFLFLGEDAEVREFHELVIVNGRLHTIQLEASECVQVPGAKYIARLTAVPVDDLMQLCMAA